MFRGNERRVIFRDDNDRLRFLKQLGESVEMHQVRLHVVCLMPNHAHLLVGTPRANLSRFVERLLTAYAVYFNLRHHRAGHVTQGRFKAQLVEGDEYLLKLSRYIHLNPVSGKEWRGVPIEERVRVLRSYPWSTYRGYVGLAESWPFIEMRPVLALVSEGRMSDAPAAYQSFVESGLAEDDGAFAALYRRATLSVGSEEFNRRVERQHRGLLQQARRKEDISFRRVETVRTASEVIKTVTQIMGIEPAQLAERKRNSIRRGVTAWALQRFAGLTQREVADYLGIGTGGAVSRQLSRWRRDLASEAVAQQLAAAIERVLRPG
jgi:REP element-mobilizing transposase RayT/flagellar biosynthesis regulator FlaF